MVASRVASLRELTDTPLPLPRADWKNQRAAHNIFPWLIYLNNLRLQDERQILKKMSLIPGNVLLQPTLSTVQPSELANRIVLTVRQIYTVSQKWDQ